MAEEKLPSFEDAEREVLAQTVRENPAPVSLTERAINLFLSGLNILKGKQPKDDAVWLLMYLVIRSVNSARWAFETLMRGYYTQALALVRTVQEDWLTADYLRKYPEKAKYWLEEKYAEEPRSKEIPTFKQMSDDLGLSSIHKEIYGLLSQFAHPRYRAFAFIVEDRDSSIYLRLGPHYDRLQFVGACDALLRVASLMRSILALFVGNHDPDWVRRTTRMQDEIKNW